MRAFFRTGVILTSVAVISNIVKLIHYLQRNVVQDISAINLIVLPVGSACLLIAFILFFKSRQSHQHASMIDACR